MDIVVVINNIINQVLSNFDFAYMVVINIMTYIIIKVIDHINKDKAVNTWTKRLVLLIASSIVFILYYVTDYNNIVVLINSTIVTPVFWSWVLKPILNKFGLDYKKIDNTLN